eukprot:COSAG03_NODE_691_length_6283_cov_5.537354_2_plen_171_part_00
MQLPAVASAFSNQSIVDPASGCSTGKRRSYPLHARRAAAARRAGGGADGWRACSNWRETGTKRRSVDALRQLTRVCCVPIHHRTPTAVSIASSASIYGHSGVHTAFPGTSRSPLSPYIPWALECVSPRSPPLDPLEVCMISHLRAGGGLNAAQAGIPAPVWSRNCCCFLH